MKRIIKYLAGIVVGVFAVLLISKLILPDKLFVVAESKLGFDETADAIVEAAEANSWTISHIYDKHATMKKNGFEVPSIYVFSLCNPGFAYNILQDDDDRKISAIMPCRVSVFEKGGKTFVSLMNTNLFAPFMSKSAKQTLAETTKETWNMLKPVIQ